MNLSISKLIAIFLISLFMFIFGIILTRAGKPYNSIILAIHKLLSFISLVIALLIFINMLKSFNLSLINILFLSFTLLILILTFISGILVSSLKNVNSILLYFHRISPFVFIVLTFISYFLFKLKK